MADIATVKKATASTQMTSVEAMIKKAASDLGEALPAHMNSERLVRIALTTIRTNPELMKCTQASLLGALFQSAFLGLEPNIEGQAYILPFNNRRKIDGNWITVKEAQFQIGYKGYVQLFHRHKSAISLMFEAVYEHDHFDYEYGTAGYLRHKPAEKDRGEVRGFYAVAKLSNSGTTFKYMSKDECLEHGRLYSKCFDKQTGKFYDHTPWASHPDAMCLKTVLMQLMKLLPKSIEIQKAIASDESIKTKVAIDMSTVPDEAVWDEPEVSTEKVETKPPTENGKTPDEGDLAADANGKPPVETPINLEAETAPKKKYCDPNMEFEKLNTILGILLTALGKRPLKERGLLAEKISRVKTGDPTKDLEAKIDILHEAGITEAKV